MSKKRKFYQKKRFMVPFSIGIALVFLGIFGAFHSSLYQTTTNSYVDDYSIKIIPKISSKIIELNLENESQVKKGEIVAELDGAIYVEKIKKLEKEFLDNKAEIENFDDEIRKINQQNDYNKEQLEKAKINLENANEDYVRYKNAFKEGIAVKKDLDNAIENLDIAQEQYENAQENLLNVSKELKEVLAKKDTKNLKSQAILEELENSRLELSALTIISPKNGKIVNLNAKAGDIATSDKVLFEILPDECYVVANFKNLPNNEIKIGQKAIIKIYSLGFKKFEGSVVEFLPSKNSLISTKIKINGCTDKKKIKTGARAYVKVKTK